MATSSETPPRRPRRRRRPRTIEAEFGKLGKLIERLAIVCEDKLPPYQPVDTSISGSASDDPFFSIIKALDRVVLQAHLLQGCFLSLNSLRAGTGPEPAEKPYYAAHIAKPMPTRRKP